MIDAVTLYPDVQLGELRALEIVDGATIRPLIDSRGRIPRPPMPAFSQILYGIPSTWYAADQLIYKPLNAKSHTVYGESPIEWALTAINTAIRKDAQRIGAFTDGNIPGSIVFVDVQTPEQKAIIEEYTNAIMKGEIARASQLLFLPSGTGSNVFHFTQNDLDSTVIDEYRFKIACWAFGNSPSEFGMVSGQGLGGAGFMQGAENTQYRSMIDPISGYVAQLANRVIREFMNRRDVKFQWKDAAPQEDRLQQSQVDQAYINAGVYGADYVQDRLGISEKYRQSAQATPQAPQFGGGGIPTIPTNLMPYLKSGAKYELHRWRTNAVAFMKGKTREVFTSDILPADLQTHIREALNKCQTADEAAAVFDPLLGDAALQKSLAPILADPLSPLKGAAERELQAAITEYFAGLQQRVIQSAVE